MTSAVIVDAVRSPMGRGRAGGALAGLHPVDLLAQVLRRILGRNDVDPGLVDDVLIGCVSQAGEQSATPGAPGMARRRLPDPRAVGQHRAQVRLRSAGRRLRGMGDHGRLYETAVAGGVESMSRVPMGSARMDADPFGPRVRERFPDVVPQGVSAELVATRWGLSRDALDQYSVASQERAASARDSGAFDHEIVPITVPADGGDAQERIVSIDETIRESRLEKLATLAPAFASDRYAGRFPEIDWKVTAANYSQIADGASVLLLMSEERAAALGLRARARVVASAVVGDDPTLMLTGPIPATRKVLERVGLSIDDIDAVEVNEAFASVPLAWHAEFPIDDRRLNPRGGAIALGHPLGASGGRHMTTLINHLEATGGCYGLQTMCEAGGMANATIIEILSEAAMKLQGSSAVVTGGASGLGLATVKRLVEAGAHTVILDLPISEGQARADELGDGASFVPADVTVTDEVAAALHHAKSHAPLRALVHCAGRGGTVRLVERDGSPGSLELYETLIRVNLIGTFNVLRLASARMATNDPVDGERVDIRADRAEGRVGSRARGD